MDIFQKLDNDINNTMKPTGTVTLSWGMKPCLVYVDKHGKKSIMYGGAKTDKLLHPEYFTENEEWPVNPETKERLPIENWK